MKSFQAIKLNPLINVIEIGPDGGMADVSFPHLAYAKARVIFSTGGGWDHVSVSFSKRCPTWQEMCQIKDMFFKDDEMAVQYHPAKKDYINNHPYVLHLWRCQTEPMPMPPKEFV